MNATLGTRITRTGLIVYGCAVFVLLSGLVARQLFPETSIGSFLSSTAGVAIALFVWWLAVMVIGVALTKFGYPCTSRKGMRDV